MQKKVGDFFASASKKKDGELSQQSTSSKYLTGERGDVEKRLASEAVDEADKMEYDATIEEPKGKRRVRCLDCLKLEGCGCEVGATGVGRRGKEESV